MHTQAIPVPNPPHETSSRPIDFYRTTPTTSAPNPPACRHSARNKGPAIDYDETKYNEEEFKERNASPKDAIPRFCTGLPSSAVNENLNANATKESHSDASLRGPGQSNATTINTTNRMKALAGSMHVNTQAMENEEIAETFQRAASSSSVASDFSSRSVPNSPTANATSPTSPTSATSHTSAAIDKDAPGDAVMNDTESESDMSAAAGSTSGLSKIYKIRMSMHANDAPVPSAPPPPNAASDEQQPDDMDMPDAAGSAEIEEISTHPNFALFMAQVCLFF